MSGVQLSLFLAGLSFIAVSSSAIAQTPDPSMTSEAIQPGVDMSSPQPSEADHLFQQGRQQFYQGELETILPTFQQVIDLRRQAGDRLGEAEALNVVAEIYNRLGNSREAQELTEQSLATVRDPNLTQQQPQRRQSIEADALDSLVPFYFRQRNLDEGLEAAQTALTIRRQLDDRIGEGKTLILAGAALLNQGQQVKAREALEESLRALREPTSSAEEQRRRRFYEGEALAWLGYLELGSGNIEQAESSLEQALVVNRETGNRSYGESNTYYFLAALQSKQSKFDEALETYQQLLNLSREIGHRWNEGNALLSIGGIYQAQNQNDQALAAYQQGAAVFQEVGDYLAQAETLSAMAGMHQEQKQYQPALEKYQQALAIYRDVENRTSEALTLQLIGITYQLLQQYPQALEQLQLALVISRETENHPLEAQTLAAIGNCYLAQKQYSQAIETYQQALLLYGGLRDLFIENGVDLVPVDVLLGQIHVNSGVSYFSLGKYSESQEYLAKGIEISLKTLIDARENSNREMESPIIDSLAIAYQTLGQTYMEQKQYEQAAELFQKILELAQQSGNEEQERKALELLLGNYALQGRAYQAQQDYENQLKNWQQVLELAQENNMPHQQAQALLGIGNIYGRRQNFAQALNYQRQALENAEQINDRSLQVQALYARGGIYQKLLRYPDALKDFQDAHSLLQAIGDPLGAAVMLNAMGGIYTAQNQFEQALNAYQEVDKALQDNPFSPFESGINADNVEAFCEVSQRVGSVEGLFISDNNCASAYALGIEALKQSFVLDGLNANLEGFNQTLLTLRGSSLHSIGQLYLKQENYEQALTYYQQALPIVREARSPIEGATLGDIGAIYHQQGKYDQAVALLQQSVEISRAFNHRINEEDALYFLGLAYWAKGDVTSALNTLSQNVQVETESLVDNLAIGSEAHKRTFLSGQSRSTDISITFHLQSAPQNSEAAKLAFTTVLQRKGRILDSVSNNVQRLRQNLQPEDQELLDDLNTFRAALVNLFYSEQNTLSAEEFKTQVSTLKTKIDELENTLAQRSTEFRAEVQPITTEAVQALIPADSALVEFVHYYPYDSKANSLTSEAWGTPHYAAVILTSQGDPKWIDLGEAAPIDQTVKEFRNGLRNQMGEAEVREKGQTLYNLLMSKVQAEVGTARHLLISPDSQLNLIPFAALVTPQNQYLVETHTITYLTSGRDLLRLQTETAGRPSHQTPVIIANPDFDRPGNSESAPVASILNNGNPPEMPTQTSNQRSADLGTRKVARLAGTEQEAAAIASLFPNILRLEGSQATENALKQLHSPSILHIATHGFFFADAPSFTPANASTNLNNENPLLRSGLALAGFNVRQSGSEDGVLTALEVAGLDLRGTRLVVLSACDTGLGGILNGEGVYGLRRAFVIAGAESQMVSLWRVNDEASAELMGKYYQLLKEGRDRSEALRQVQLEMIRSSDYSNPYFWSAFIFSGDWRKMEGL
jgi:tetratricopeptide (TPR) repeat protein